MAIHSELRLLAKKWQSGTGWPKRLEWIEVKGLRGWTGQRVEFGFPITAIVGENGSGKSTLLQAAACVYQVEEKRKARYASEFYPDTAWDKVHDASIRYGYGEGDARKENSARKPTTRWLGNVDRPMRPVEYIDLSRIQPVSGRVGYAKIAKTKHKEASAKLFNQEQVQRFSAVMGRAHDSARMALSDSRSSASPTLPTPAFIKAPAKRR
jgi:energy-coupling factor transporter ATP-binding protein EcfA2